MDECICCGAQIINEFFEGTSGIICEKCLKNSQVYYGLRSLDMIKNQKEKDVC